MKNEKGAIEININLGILLFSIFFISMVGAIFMDSREARPIESNKGTVVIEHLEQLKDTPFNKTYKELVVLYQSDGYVSQREYKTLSSVFNGYMVARSTNTERQYIDNVISSDIKQAKKDAQSQKQFDNLVSGKNKTFNCVVVILLILIVLYLVLFVFGPY